MRVEITAEQQELEEKHARSPDRRRTAEPGQDHLRDEGLNLKQQKGAEENRAGVK
ncbi:MAG: hypothetical protein ABIZ80_24325 [Bryobacteraceae bacterium]